jgi:uncharacterized low-complexity protein
MKTFNNLKTLSITSGAVLVLSVASGGALAADSNPFGMTKLNEGYQVATSEGKCGEGKCGESKAKKAEGKCGGTKAEEAEGKCGGNKPKEAEGKCGGSKAE